MLTSKNRAVLKALAGKIEPILQVGKNGVGPQLIKQVDDALEARELIKLSVHETAPDDVKTAAEALAQATRSEVVVTLGRRMVLYRKSKTKQVIEL